MTRLIATTAAVLLAGTAVAAAQGTPAMGNKSEGAAPAPAVQQKAPAERAAPAQKPQAQMGKPADTTGQAQREPSGGTFAPNSRNSAGEDKRPNKAATDDSKASANGNSSFDKSANEKMNDKSKAATDDKAKADVKTGANAKDKATTSGQGAAGARGAANLSTEQRTKIRTVIKEKVHARPLTNVNFSISVGTRVPHTVHFYPLPVEVVEIYPEWRGYSFILVGDEIVIIEPATYEIVAVVAA
jgi:hypothetical protein